jgi:hypothetical protein
MKISAAIGDDQYQFDDRSCAPSIKNPWHIRALIIARHRYVAIRHLSAIHLAGKVAHRGMATVCRPYACARTEMSQ